MSNDDCLAVCTFDHRCHDVTQVKANFSQRMVFATIIYDELMQSARLSCHSRHSNETVTSVDIHTIGNRSDTVSRIHISITMYGVIRTPLSFCKSCRAHTQLTTLLISIIYRH